MADYKLKELLKDVPYQVLCGEDGTTVTEIVNDSERPERALSSSASKEQLRTAINTSRMF